MSVVSAVVVIVFAFLIALCRNNAARTSTVLDRRQCRRSCPDTRIVGGRRWGHVVGVIVAAELADQASVDLQAGDIGVNDQALSGAHARGAVAIRAGWLAIWVSSTRLR